LAADYNSEQPVALNIDGVQITRGPVAAIGFFDLESVEVLKGPQALFFGKNSPAGVVSVQSVTPGDKLEGYVRAGYEFSASTPSFDGAVSIPLTDTLSVRFAGHYSHDNSGYIENTARPTANPFDGPTEPLPGAANTEGPLDRDGIGRVTVAWRPEGNFDATLKVLGSYHHDWNSNTAENISCGANAHPTDVNPLTGQAVQDPFGDCSANHQISVGNGPAGIVNTFAGGPADGQPFTEARAWVSSLQMHYQFADKLDLTSITGYYHNNYAAFGNFDGTVFAQALDAENIVNTQMSEELRLASNFDSPVNFTVGTYYEHQKQETTNTDKVAPLPPYPIPGPYFGASNTVAMEAANKADSYSAFGQVSWKILENLELAGGARYTHDERSASVQSVLNYFDLLAPAFGSDTPAPISVNSSACSNTTTAQPALCKPRAAVKPAIPAPAMTMGEFTRSRFRKFIDHGFIALFGIHRRELGRFLAHQIIESREQVLAARLTRLECGLVRSQFFDLGGHIPAFQGRDALDRVDSIACHAQLGCQHQNHGHQLVDATHLTELRPLAA
jgi:outer membrane receptor protein involved in Fe transport